MNQRTKALFPLALTATAAIFATLLAVPALAAPAAKEPAQSQTAIHKMVTLTGEVVAIDAVNRQVTLRGPLGGEISGRVEDDVKNLGQVKVGDMVSISYYASVALSAAKPGERSPLFATAEVATAGAGKRPAAYAAGQSKHTVTVIAVDPEKRAIVFQGEDGTLFPAEVERPEFARKLQTVRVGDKIDVEVTEAVIAEVRPAGAGAKPGLSAETSTLMVDRGEVVWRSGNNIIVRDDRGRSVKVAVDPKFKFLVDGQQITVGDLKVGTKLTRTALRVEKVESQ